MKHLRFMQDRKGNMTITWVVMTPVFLIIFMFLGSLGLIWMNKSVSVTAGDAGSLAATKKLDEWLLLSVDKHIRDQLNETLMNPSDRKALLDQLPKDSKLRKRLEQNRPIDDLPLEDKLKGIFNTKEAQKAFIQMVLNQHESELKSTVREYVVKNGGYEHGTITFPVDGRIEVKAKTHYKPLIFQDAFRNQYIEGIGVGPKRFYLELLPDETFVVQF